MNIMQTIRTNARNNGIEIANHLQNHYMTRKEGRPKLRPVQEICSFCTANKDITNEHVLPRWVFGENPNHFFNTAINGLSHKYNQTTIPACQRCNNDLLGAFEK